MKTLKAPPPILRNENALSAYVMECSPHDVDVNFVREYFFDTHAVLRRIRLADLLPGPESAHLQDKKKAKHYERRPLSTMPPILVENGKIIDGHHRYRRARSGGAEDLLCYEIRGGREPKFFMMIMNYEELGDALSGKIDIDPFNPARNCVTPHWLSIAQVPYWFGLPLNIGRKDQYQWVLAIESEPRPTEMDPDAHDYHVAGMIELQRSPFDPSIVWLKNIGVNETHRQQGVASSMIDMLPEAIARFGIDIPVIERSRPSLEGAAYTLKRIDRVLDDADLQWRQVDRSRAPDQDIVRSKNRSMRS